MVRQMPLDLLNRNDDGRRGRLGKTGERLLAPVA